MAALPDRVPSPGASLIDLRDLQPEHLVPLLDEETQAWRRELDWDFQASAELVRRFLQVRALNGFALVDGDHRKATVSGYSYYVVEEGKGLIGDFYVRSSAAGAERESRLMEAVLEAMWRTPGVRRIEAQLLMLPSRPDRAVPFGRWFRQFPRQFMEARIWPGSLQSSAPPGVVFGPWVSQLGEETARLIATAYRDHVDSLINDQYRSVAGAARFLMNIVQYPGCGLFYAPASFAARDASTGNLCGISLASLVSPSVGHITQLCVAPSFRGRQVGYELLRRSIEALGANRCRAVTLTVTAANRAAARLYESAGFHLRRDFAAYIWEIA